MEWKLHWYRNWCGWCYNHDHTDAVVTGFYTWFTNATSLNVTTGFSTVQSLTADDITVSVGAFFQRLNVGATTVGGALTVTGNAILMVMLISVVAAYDGEC